MTGFVLFGVELPLWALLIIGLLIVIVAWKLIKFALKILLIIVVFFIILIAIDYFNVIGAIQNLFTNIF
jgi:hypothetical protein